MAAAVYILCALTSILCAFLLARAHRRQRVPLLFWSAVCFAGLALNNILLVMDYLILPSVDLSLLRVAVGFVSMVIFLVALIWEPA